MSENFQKSSLSLVKDDFIDGLRTAVNEIDDWMEDESDVSHLEEASNVLMKLSGTSKMLNLAALSMLLSESATVISAGHLAGFDKEKRATFATKLLKVERYVDWLIDGGTPAPEVLYDDILAYQRITKPAKPAYIHTWLKGVHPAVEIGDYTASVDDLRRLRIMYQTGLLTLLKGENERAVLLLDRAASRLGSMSSDADKLLWSSLASLIKAVETYELPKFVKRQFRFPDSYLATRIRGAQDVESFNAAWGAICWIAAALKSEGVEVQVDHFDGALSSSLSEIVVAIDQLGGVTSNTLTSVAALIQEDLVVSRELLEVMALDVENRDSSRIDQLIGQLKRLADTLEVVQLGTVAVLVRGLIDETLEGSLEKVLDDAIIEKIADTLLYVDSCLSKIKHRLDVGIDAFDLDARNKQVAESLLEESQQLVLEEAKIQVASMKQSLNGFVESGFDPEQVANVPEALRCLEGIAFILSLERAGNLIRRSTEFVSSKVTKDANEGGLEPMLETFADALIGLEYYFDQLAAGAEVDEKILDMADQSLTAVGYA